MLPDGIVLKMRILHIESRSWKTERKDIKGICEIRLKMVMLIASLYVSILK
jgi:hypothetical protein